MIEGMILNGNIIGAYVDEEKIFKDVSLEEQYMYEIALSRNYYDNKDSGIFNDIAEETGYTVNELGEIAIEAAKKIHDCIEKNANKSVQIDWDKA